jgi:hypothetical protein
LALAREGGIDAIERPFNTKQYTTEDTTMHRLCFILGTIVTLFGLFFLHLVYAIGISGNTDQRPIAYFIIVTGVLLFVMGFMLWPQVNGRSRSS